MIPDHKRKVIIENYVRGLINSDRCDKNYLYIERLWNASGLSNRDLVDELLSDHENAADDFKDSIFWDMVWLLKNAILEDDALRSLFSDLYAKRYTRADKYVQELERKANQGKKVVINDAEVKKFQDKHSLDETGFFLFRIFNSDVLVTNDCIDYALWKRHYDHASAFMDNEAQHADENIVFTDGSEAPVFTSKQFERFVDRQKQALADYLNVPAEELARFYDTVMTLQESSDFHGINYSNTPFGRISAAITEIIWLHGGSVFWLANIQSLDRKNKLGYRYRPNFDKLFEKYCRANVLMAYMDFVKSTGSFTPLTLSRKCAFEDLEVLAVSMGYMYMCDVMHQMYIQMQKQYYINFSWEQFRNKDLRERYDVVISDLKASLASRDAQLHNLRILYNELRDRLEKKNDRMLIKEIQDKERLLQLSEDKDAEIERLKAIIESQNQLIGRLQSEPDEDDIEQGGNAASVNTDSIIYQHKYLFVGDITALGFEDLRRKFPSSVFMESNTTNISQIQVDAVVYLIQAMGHSMYYKCKNTPALQNAKVIYYNGRGNTTTLLKLIETEWMLQGQAL